MSIEEVVKGFNKGLTKGNASGGRVRIEGDKLINFDTVIAIRTDKGIKLNARKYSRTTSKLQNKIRYYCNVIEEYQGADAIIYSYGW